MRISLGATIVCQGDVEAGRVERLVAAPSSSSIPPSPAAPDTVATTEESPSEAAQLSITHLIVGEGGILNHAVVVPISSVKETEPFRVYLNLDIGQLQNMPAYSEVDFVTPPANCRSPSSYTSSEIVSPVERAAEAWIDKGRLFVGQEVSCIDGQAGVIRELRTQPIGGKVVYVIVGTTAGSSALAVVPLEWIQSIDGSVVKLACTVSQLSLWQLPDLAD